MHHSNDFKLSAVNHYLKNDNYLQTSELFNCKRTSLMRWVKRYNETGNVLNQPRNTTSYKVMQKHVDHALQQIQKEIDNAG
jgi:transposase-like protein